jgi:hypothetical protein
MQAFWQLLAFCVDNMLAVSLIVNTTPKRHTLMEFTIIVLPGYVISIEGSESYTHNIPKILELFES